MQGMSPKKPLSLLLCLVLAMATAPLDSGTLLQAQTTAATSNDYPGQGTPLNEEDLQALVAPIALYPDALVAQILNGATFPDQIAVADYWLQQNKNLTGTALTTAINGQAWDPSVKALTQFPSVLDNMSKNLSWTSQLGEAYHNQESDVMAAIQALRSCASSLRRSRAFPT